jgi:hypothetical protein
MLEVVEVKEDWRARGFINPRALRSRTFMNGPNRLMYSMIQDATKLEIDTDFGILLNHSLEC